MITISIIIIIINTIIKTISTSISTTLNTNTKITKDTIRTSRIIVLIIAIIIASRGSINTIEILSGLFETERINNIPVMTKTIGMISKIGVYIIGITIIIMKQKEEKRFEEIIKLFLILGMLLLIYSSDLIAALIAIELQSLALYIINIKSNKRAISAGIMYYIIGSISSVILIIGIVIIYKNTGVTSIEGIKINNNSKIMMIIIIISLLIKLGAAPFHYWVADVYSGLTTDRTIIIGSLGKISIIIFISKLIEESSVIIVESLSIIIIISLIIGSIGGLSTYRMKRIIGYSSISHIGWMLIGESRFYVYQYFISVVIILANIINRIAMNNISIIISIFSLAGIPPLIGFIGKIQILYITIIDGNYLIAIILIITSVISAGYYLRMIVNLTNVSLLFLGCEGESMGYIIIAIMTIYQIIYGIL